MMRLHHVSGSFSCGVLAGAVLVCGVLAGAVVSSLVLRWCVVSSLVLRSYVVSSLVLRWCVVLLPQALADACAVASIIPDRITRSMIVIACTQRGSHVVCS
jgi:hypothetical protein